MSGAAIVQKVKRMSIAQPLSFSGPQPLWPPQRFTIEQYHRMIETGVLTPDDPVQLLQGVVVRMAPKGPWHVYAVTEVADQLYALLPAGWHIRRQDPITLADSEPEPDVVAARGSKRRYRKRHPFAKDVGLVVEVADSTLLLDRHQKASIYSAAGIVAYWIANLADRQVEVFAKPQPAGLRRAARYGRRRVVGKLENARTGLGRAEGGGARSEWLVLTSEWLVLTPQRGTKAGHGHVPWNRTLVSRSNAAAIPSRTSTGQAIVGAATMAGLMASVRFATRGVAPGCRSAPFQGENAATPVVLECRVAAGA
jgi:Uma2 family endonuclease